MKKLLFTVLMLSWLNSCSQAEDMVGEYEKVSEHGSIEFLLTLNPDGTFQFDSYTVRQIDGDAMSLNSKKASPTGPGLSGRGTWSVKRDVIHFRTNPATDKNYKYPLDLDGARAKFRLNSSNESSKEKELAKIDFVDSKIFWVEGLALKKRN